MTIEILRPNAPGDECYIVYETGADCPDHYLNVAEAVSDSHTTEVRNRSSSFVRDLYNIQDHSVGSGVINKITVKANCISDSVGAVNLRLEIKAGTGAGAPDTFGNSGFINVATSWTIYSFDFLINPATSSPFTWDEIDKIQIGPNIGRPALNDWTYVTQIWLEVDYELAPEVEPAAVDVGIASSAERSLKLARESSVDIGIAPTADRQCVYHRYGWRP